MEFGAHPPLISFDGELFTKYAEVAATLGFRTLCANDHLIFSRPWFDGLTALATVAASAGQMTLATTVSLPIMPGPVDDEIRQLEAFSKQVAPFVD